MGIKNGPAMFQRLMDGILGNPDCCSVYVDDIVIGSRGATEEEAIKNHAADVKEVLERLRKHGIVAEVSKTAFFTKSVEFCGHILEGGARRPQPGKMMAIQKYSAPTTLKELRGFLGLANYYSGYIKDYAELANPLMQLLKGRPKNSEVKSTRVKIEWMMEQEKALLSLKEVLTKVVPLTLLDHDKDIYLSPDASKYAMGCALEQRGCSCVKGKTEEEGCKHPL